MQKGREFLLDLVKKQKDCQFSLKFFLQNEESRWKNVLTMLELAKKGTVREVYYDYDDFVFGTKLLDIQKGLDTISSLYPEEDKKGKLAIPDYDEFVIQSVSDKTQIVPSKRRQAYLRKNWPMMYCAFNVQQNQQGQCKNCNLLKEGLPYYPNVTEGVIDLFDLVHEHFSSPGKVYVAILDYRARIESMKLSFSKVELKVNFPEIAIDKLAIKVFAKSGLKRTTLPDIYPKSEIVGFDVGFQPDTLSVALLSRHDDIKIDEKEFATWREEEEGVYIERPEEEILALTRTGENQHLEYKYDVINENQKNDFIETIIAFLNTNRGVILVGVSDDGNTIESRIGVEDIEKVIHDSCDPPLTNIKVEPKKILGKKVIIVDVPEGDNKPYQSKRDKNFYVRHNATDMRMERSELLQLLEKQQEQSQYIGI